MKFVQRCDIIEKINVNRIACGITLCFAGAFYIAYITEKE